MNYLLPLEWTTTFIPLQDKCPVSSIESIEAMFVQDTGEKISDYFSEFAPEPIGAASLAQVQPDPLTSRSAPWTGLTNPIATTSLRVSASS